MVKIIGNDSYIADENVAYLIDYQVRSATVGGTNNKGSIYIRGVKGSLGFDSFKFILEKANDFNDFDAELVINAYEQAMKPRTGGQSVAAISQDELNMTPAQLKFKQKQAAKSNLNPQPTLPGMEAPATKVENEDP